MGAHHSSPLVVVSPRNSAPAVNDLPVLTVSCAISCARQTTQQRTHHTLRTTVTVSPRLASPAVGRSCTAILVVGPSPGFMKKMAPSGTTSPWQHDGPASIRGSGREDRSAQSCRDGGAAAPSWDSSSSSLCSALQSTLGTCPCLASTQTRPFSAASASARRRMDGGACEAPRTRAQWANGPIVTYESYLRTYDGTS